MIIIQLKQNVNSHFKYELIPKKNESHLTNSNVYDLESQNTDRARPYCISFYRLSKLAGRYNRDLSQYELEKCEKGTLYLMVMIVLLKHLIFFKFKAEKRKVKNKIVDYNVRLHAHIGSGFDT